MINDSPKLSELKRLVKTRRLKAISAKLPSCGWYEAEWRNTCLPVGRDGTSLGFARDKPACRQAGFSFFKKLRIS